jgi:CRP/FNR family transcriptional regulator, cyclic AMP receptor protein
MNARLDLVQAAIWGSELTEEEAERASRGVVDKVFAKGSYICHRGDRLDYWTGVINGLVKVSTISRSGKAMTFAGVASGAWFGEGSVLKDEPRKYDVVALRDTRLMLMHRATFFWLYENSAGFSRFLVRQLNERVGQFLAMIEFDRILSPRARVARGLTWFFNPVLYPRTSDHIEISQDELALLAGISRQVANRSLQALEAENLIRVEHGRIMVLNLEGLRSYEG